MNHDVVVHTPYNIAFKVVRTTSTDGVFQSVLMQSIPVYYKIGHKACAPHFYKNKGLHLLAFDSYSAALDFYIGGEERILLCEAHGLVSPMPAPLPYNHLNGLYEGKASCEWPENTVMYRGLTPLKNVTPAYANRLAALRGNLYGSL